GLHQDDGTDVLSIHRPADPRQHDARVPGALEHDPEKWEPIFREDHAQIKKARNEQPEHWKRRPPCISTSSTLCPPWPGSRTTGTPSTRRMTKRRYSCHGNF